jgi:large repetitive protein
MKKVLVVLISICGLVLLNGCGTTTTPPQQVVSHFSVTSTTAAPVAGTAINFTVTALDDKNNPVATYSGSAHFTSSDAQAVLPASATITNGTGTGSVTLKTAGPQTVTAAGTDLLTGTSSAIPVSAAAPSQFSVTAATAASLTGATFKFTVTAQDAFKNTATSYAGTLNFASSDPKAVLPANNSSLTNGTKDFSAILQTVGSESITATDTAKPSITGNLSSLAVSAPAALGITNGTLPDGAVGILYHEVCYYRAGCSSVNPLDATGGVPPYSWSWAAAAGSSLPPGVGISNIFRCQTHNQSGPCAAITGRPSAAGTYNVVLTVTDSATPAAQKNRLYPLTIIPKLVITPGNPPDGVIGTAYNFTFTTSGGKPPITLSVGSGTLLPAGLSFDASTGAITGTPTTAELSNFAVVATDSGAQQQTTSNQLSLSVNPPAVNNAELKGQYAFSFQGFDGQPVASIGSFTADGAGNLTGGLQDVKRTMGVTASQAFVGTYEIYADNRGSFKLKTSPGGTDLGTFRFAVGSITAGVASKARFVEFDNTSTRGGGFIEKQDPTAFSTSKINGDYAFGVSSALFGYNSFISYGAAGRFTAAAGNITSGNLDEDNQGTVNSDASFTGTYSVAATGRGTMTLNVTGSANPVNAVFYVVSSGELLVMNGDTPGVNSLFAGRILQQTGAGTFSNASLNSASIVDLHGLDSTAGHDVVLGVLSIPSAGNFTLAADENNAGIIQVLNQAGTYTAAANGRVSVTGTPHPLVFYLVGANKGFVVSTDSNASTGFFEPQTGGPFSTASANGTFFLGPSTPVNTIASSADSGVVMFNGTGGVTGTTDVVSGGSLLPYQPFADTYAISVSGRGTMSTSAFIFYVISPSKFVLMDGGVGVTRSTITVGEK